MFFQEIGLTKKEDITNDLRGQTVKRNDAHVSQIVQGILHSMNPFADVQNPEVLFNISIGKAASEETTASLLNCRTIGETEKSNFIQECSTDMPQFEKPIKCVAIRTFATDAGRQKVKAKDGKVVAACLMQDLFRSLLPIFLQQNIDIAEVMKFPLKPFPLSISSIDGTMHKSPKSKLMGELEHRVSTTPPETVDVYVSDAAFFLHLFKELPGTFGGVAKFLLKRLLINNAKRDLKTGFLQCEILFSNNH